MHLYDTARREIVPFEPGPIVTMYTCGITPYDATHLGHAAVYVTYDVLQRRLRDLGHEFQPLVPPRGSVAASVQAALPKSKVAAGFHHVPAKELGDLDHPVESDVLICSDHLEATEATCEIVRKIPDMRPLDAGELSNAAPIEAFAAVLLQLNVRYKTRAAVKFTGIDAE